MALGTNSWLSNSIYSSILITRLFEKQIKKRLSLKTQFKIAFLPPFTNSRKVLEKMPAWVLFVTKDTFAGRITKLTSRISVLFSFIHSQCAFLILLIYCQVTGTTIKPKLHKPDKFKLHSSLKLIFIFFNLYIFEAIVLILLAGNLSLYQILLFFLSILAFA